MSVQRHGLRVKWYGAIPIRYRPESSDDAVIREVIDKRCYKKPSIGFDVETEERWLDLGANIGAFAVYCKLRGAEVVCYEPELACYDILVRNAAPMACVRAAVTHSMAKQVTLWRNSGRGRFSPKNVYQRDSVLKFDRNSSEDARQVPNVFAGDLGEYTGVKMDIEGSEHGIIDAHLIPRCEKLCVEYHMTRDKSCENLNRRLEILRDLFYVVRYPTELDRLSSQTGMTRTFFDRTIFCMKRKTP